MREPEDILPFRLRGKPVRRDHSFPAAYQLTHVRTGDVYVGSTQDLYVRLNKHMTRLALGEHRSRKLQEVYDLHPDFRIDYCMAVDREDAYDMEQDLLDFYRLHDNLLNIAMNSRSNGLGVSRSEETKARLREATNRQFSTPESRQAQSARTVAMWQDPDFRERATRNCRVREQASAGGRAFNDRMRDDPVFRANIVAKRSKPITYRGVEYPSIVIASERTGIPKSTIGGQIRRERKLRND